MWQCARRAELCYSDRELARLANRAPQRRGICIMVVPARQCSTSYVRFAFAERA